MGQWALLPQSKKNERPVISTNKILLTFILHQLHNYTQIPLKGTVIIVQC